MAEVDLHERTRGPLSALLRRWWLALPLAVLGVVAGVSVARAGVAQYTAEARVVVGSGALAQYQVPGFAAASEQLAANYSRYVGSQVALGRVNEFIRPVDESVTGLSASPIPDSNLIRIEVTGSDPEAAAATAQAVAERLVEMVAAQADEAGTPDEQLEEFTRFSQTVGDAQARLTEARAELERLVSQGATAEAVVDVRNRVAAATSAVDIARLQQDAAGAAYRQTALARTTSSRLSVVADAVVVGDDLRSRGERFGLLGLVLGLLLALAAAQALEQRSSRSAVRVAVPADGGRRRVRPREATA